MLPSGPRLNAWRPQLSSTPSLLVDERPRRPARTGPRPRPGHLNSYSWRLQHGTEAARGFGSPPVGHRIRGSPARGMGHSPIEIRRGRAQTMRGLATVAERPWCGGWESSVGKRESGAKSTWRCLADARQVTGRKLGRPSVESTRGGQFFRVARVGAVSERRRSPADHGIRPRSEGSYRRRGPPNAPVARGHG